MSDIHMDLDLNGLYSKYSQASKNNFDLTLMHGYTYLKCDILINQDYTKDYQEKNIKGESEFAAKKASLCSKNMLQFDRFI